MRLVLLALPLLSICAASQATAPPQPVIRYHYGDNPAWASPSFDDSSWPVADQGSLSRPPFRSDGFFWVRVHVQVPAVVDEPLGVQSLDAMRGPGVEQIFVNGTPVGQIGSFPPQAAPRLPPRTLTFALPTGAFAPGPTVLVALRGWSSPIDRVSSNSFHFALAIDRLSVLRTAAQADFATAFLATLPPILPNLLLFLLGIALLVVLRRSAGRELLLNAYWLITLPLYLIPISLLNAGLFPSFVTARAWLLFYTVAVIPGFWVHVEFLWTVFRFRDRIVRALAHGAWILYVACSLLANLTYHPAPWILPLYFVSAYSLALFNVICLGANVWAFFVVRRNRIIAAAFSLINLTYLLAIAGLSLRFHIGSVQFASQIVEFFVAGVTITAMLVYRAIAGWRTGQRLQAEFQAARAVQQQLVPASLPPVPGFTLEAAYRPAAEVGGDFYQVLPQSGDATILVVGDVSGKGLKAAMLGTLVVGALRSLAQEDLSPSQILNRLNEQLIHSSDGGFVTCLVLRIAPGGAATVANAGHLAPYRNGDEYKCEPGLPLGLTADAHYGESGLTLAPGDTLTFLSDGVVEARSSTGELFGFDRTRQISTQSAEQIAQAAQHYGQEDDITVLTLAFTGAVHA
jgi:hypothetical protein